MVQYGGEKADGPGKSGKDLCSGSCVFISHISCMNGRKADFHIHSSVLLTSRKELAGKDRLQARLLLVNSVPLEQFTFALLEKIPLADAYIVRKRFSTILPDFLRTKAFQSPISLRKHYLKYHKQPFQTKSLLLGKSRKHVQLLLWNDLVSLIGRDD